ncbi:glutathione S-transferase family protein [Legionella feeleii]|uniref:glutathione S-transferase family protein n=1 Tax=Legionella feeleii TaxID=453 RepID=UPI0039BF58DC
MTQPVNPMLAVSAEFEAISPLRKTPAFREGDYVLADSSAICAYLEKQYPSPSFYPTTAGSFR